ncbi:hypothetical protein D3C85_1319420 [compost metagenome]
MRSLTEANASFRLFNDRVILNAGIVNRGSTNDLSLSGFTRNNVGGEVEILGLIKKDGTLVGKLSNKPPTQQTIFTTSGINQNNNVTSLGLVYTQQFDSFREFLQKITGKYRRDQKKKAQQGEAPKTRQLINKEAILNEQQKNNPKK